MKFSDRVIQIIAHIPKGKVLTYGKVAEYSGNVRASRQVAYVLHSCSEKYDLPWHRVVGKNGTIKLQDPLGRQMQIDLLASEGIEVLQNTVVDYEAVQWECDLFFTEDRTDM